MAQYKHAELTEKINGCAIEVHRHWGPGLLEAIYEKSLCEELELRGIGHQCQISVPLIYKGKSLDLEYRMDLIVEDTCIVEIKSVKELADIHSAQLLTYMKIAQKPVRLLLNFNEVVLKDGIRRFVL